MTTRIQKPVTGGLAPALTLFFLTPLIAEYLLGSLSIAEIAALPVMCLLYGGGAVLIRETARMSKGGWPTIVLLGLAYGVIEESIATQSLFNPHYLHLRLLDYGYIPALKMSVYWTLYVLALHVIWSICVPIALTEALFPAKRETPWLRTTGRSVFGILFALGTIAVTKYTIKTEAFMATPAQLVTGGVVALLLIVLAFRWRSNPSASQVATSHAPSAWVAGVFALVAGSAFEVVASFQHRGIPWGFPVAIRLAILALAVWLIARWSKSAEWSASHSLAVAGGGLVVYCWWGYGVEISLHGSKGIPAHTILVILSLGVLVLAIFRVRRHTRETVPAAGVG